MIKIELTNNDYVTPTAEIVEMAVQAEVLVGSDPINMDGTSQDYNMDTNPWW